jgi:hypothetical protein
MFGYAPAIKAAQRGGCSAIWGARAIATEDPGFGLVPDRISWYAGNEAERSALALALNKGVLDVCRERFAELKDEHWDIHRVAKEYVLYEDEAIKVVGNTNGSYGYLYLTAFILPPDRTGEWRGNFRPAPGGVVNVTVNSIGEAIVLRGHRVYSVAGLYVMPINPPEWYRKQNRLGRNGWKPGWITGVEFTEIEGQEVA